MPIPPVTRILIADEGSPFSTSPLYDTLIRDFIERADERGQEFDVLTPREPEVLKLIAEGNTSKEIAAMLVISIKTVDRHEKFLLISSFCFPTWRRVRASTSTQCPPRAAIASGAASKPGG
jgi:FixJ family two-component response regulator